MAFQHVDAIEVFLYGERVGVLAFSQGRGCYAFEYFNSWLKNGFSLSPLRMPLKPGVYSFPELASDTWHKLPACIADALPDRFGNQLINAHLARHGVSSGEITPLDRLAYQADRGMGALEFQPARSLGSKRADVLDLADLVTAARESIQGRLSGDAESKKTLMNLLSVGISAGGARAKAVINMDPVSGEMRSGQHPEAGKESWLLKFDGVGNDPGLGDSEQYGRIEYAYSLMAKSAGIQMTETRLLEENGRAHFMTRRFDRMDAGTNEDSEKIHMQSLCAIDHVDYNLVGVNDYASLFSAIRRLGLKEETVTEAYRRMAFNYMAMNCDDHSKNFAFLMDRHGQWRMSPAYDITYAYNSKNVWLREHLMGVFGKFSGVTRGDLMDFAEHMKVPAARQTLKEVLQAVARWREYATNAGLSDEIAAAIESSHYHE